VTTSTPPSSRFRFDAFEVDLRSGEVWERGNRIRLQDQPFQVLRVLLERRGDIVTRDELKQALWPADTFVDFDHGLNTAVKKIRDVLGDSTERPRYIETIPRRGYRFIAPLIHCGPATVLPAMDGELPMSYAPDTIHPAVSAPSEGKTVLPTMFLGAAALLAVVTLGLVLYRGSAARSVKQPAIKSLAVLPLRNLSGDPTQEYLADGMTEALIGRLSGVHDLRVISRTSVMRFKETRLSVGEIAKTLQVDAIVEGSVIREGNRIRVHAQLIRAATDEHFWSEAYDRELQDVLSLQSDVAQTIARRVEVTITGEERARLGAARPVSPEVYEAYLKGVFLENKESPDAVRTAIRYFRTAIEQDASFAAAYARLSHCYVKLSYMSEMPTMDAYQTAKQAAQKAATLDDNLDEAHTALAAIAILDWDWPKAETEYRHAIKLNPNLVRAHRGYFYLLLILGRSEDAARQESQAAAADPLSVSTLHTHLDSAYFRRQYDAGLIKARNAVELYPEASVFHDRLSNFHTAQGNEKLSAEHILLAEKTGGASSERFAALQAANKVGGTKGLRRKRIELNKKLADAHQSINSYDIAIDCAAVGDRDQAIFWLEKALRYHDPKISLIGVEPIFDSLRSDPRFVSLLHQMGLSPART